MVNIPKEVMDIFTGQRNPNQYRAIVTISPEGVPNITPMGSIGPVDSETMMFADMATVHTKGNLTGPNKKVLIALFSPPMDAYQIKGTFVEFQTSGPLYEKWKGFMTAQKYPAPRAIGIIKVDEVWTSNPAKPNKKLA
jgi:predicted pyridoxine 5'-phosphate oxidase superfamily flavin-nucleotide-binding protein